MPPVPPYRLFLDHMGWPAGFEFTVLNYINLNFSSPYVLLLITPHRCVFMDLIPVATPCQHDHDQSMQDYNYSLY